MIKLFVLASLLASNAYSMSYEEKSIIKAAAEVGVPAPLLRALCYRESLLKKSAYNHADGGVLGSAFGMCQILYGTATDYGFADKRCKGSFVNKTKTYKTCKLFGPYTNAKIAARILKKKITLYKTHTLAIAAYNSGKPLVCPKRGHYYIRVFNDKTSKFDRYIKKCVPGGLLNQEYVDDILGSI